MSVQVHFRPIRPVVLCSSCPLRSKSGLECSARHAKDHSAGGAFRAIWSITKHACLDEKRRSAASLRCQFVPDTQDGTDPSFQVPRDPPHPSFGRQSPFDGSNLGRIAIKAEKTGSMKDAVERATQLPLRDRLERESSHQPTRNFRIAPKIATIRFKFKVHPGDPGVELAGRQNYIVTLIGTVKCSRC